MEDKKALFSTEKPGWRETLGALPFAIRLIRDVQPSLFYFLLVLSLLQGPLSFLSVYAIKRTTDALSFGLFSAGFFWAIAIAVVQEVSSIITTLRESGMDRQRFKLEMALEEKAIKHFSTLSYRTLEDPDFQTLAMAYERKTYVILNLQTNGTRIVQNIISLVGLTTGLIFIPWSAALFPILALAATAYLLVRYSNWSWDVLSHETRQGRRARYYSDLLKRPAAILPVKALSLIDPFTRRWRKLVDAVLQSKLRQNTKSFGIFILGGALEVAGLACGLLLLITKLEAGAIVLSTFVVFLTTYQRLTDLMEGMSWNLAYLIQESSFLVVLKKFFLVPQEADGGRAVPKECLVIAFEKVSFRYPNTKKDVLEELSFTFAEGDHLALVGLNGAGKSTILKLLMKVYEPTAGRITVNGIDLRDIKPSAWRNALAVLTQNDIMFDDVIREQVLYGDYHPKVNDERFERAINVSGLKDLVRSFPKKMETHAGKYYAMPEDQPIELSGGQRQIVAIARTLYRKARIYIFDEPTSAVDAEKEERFFQKLPSALQDAGVIFVSHRFSTLRRGAERVIVVDGGHVIEDGSHEELMVVSGRYAELFTLQAKSYQLEEV